MKRDAFTRKLASLLDAYIRAVRDDNKRREEDGSLEEPLGFTFENFVKWFTFVYRKPGVD